MWPEAEFIKVTISLDHKIVAATEHTIRSIWKIMFLGYKHKPSEPAAPICAPQRGETNMTMQNILKVSLSEWDIVCIKYRWSSVDAEGLGYTGRVIRVKK